jgi:hypothetical protein
MRASQAASSEHLFRVRYDVKENIGVLLDAKIKPPVPRHPRLPWQYTQP